jgi:hypothetical protein
VTDVLSTKTHFTPITALEKDETPRARFTADRATYWRENAWMAALAMALGMVVLWAIGNPHVWTGAVGGLAAIALRAFYLSSDELKMEWQLTDRRLLGPGTRAITLDNIAQVNTMLSAVQVVTVSGDKYLMKYQLDTATTKARIDQERGT